MNSIDDDCDCELDEHGLEDYAPGLESLIPETKSMLKDLVRASQFVGDVDSLAFEIVVRVLEGADERVGGPLETSALIATRYDRQNDIAFGDEDAKLVYLSVVKRTPPARD